MHQPRSHHLGRFRALGCALALALLAAACGSSGTDAVAPNTQEPQAEDSTPEQEQEPEPEPEPEPTVEVPTAETVLVVTGDEEMVFDWTTDRCEDEHIPDIAARAIRNADGLVQLYVTHYVTYAMTGTDLNDVASDCDTTTWQSAFDPDPSTFDEAGWIAAPYTEDGQTVYAVIHNEYRGFVFRAEDRCLLGDYLSCIDVSLTMAVSSDGGATYSHIAEPPNHLAASFPYVYDPEGVPSGLWQTSNLIKRDDGYHYLLVNISHYPEVAGDDPQQWACLLRSDDLADPGSWRYWNGVNFNGEFVNPYLESTEDATVCPPVARPQLDAALVEGLIYDEALGQYIAVGMTNSAVTGGELGVYYSFSDDLITWSDRQLLIELPMPPNVNADTDLRYAYPTIIDPDSASLNFDTSDGEMYLYITRMNAGGGSLDRDLMRFPIAIETRDLVAPSWDFDTDGDLGGWQPVNQLNPVDVSNGVLVASTTGDDPYMESETLRFPGPAYPAMSVEMSVTGDGDTTIGQIFFLTADDPAWSETNSQTFEIVADGTMREYTIDLSTNPRWGSTITGLRLDPGAIAGAEIEIDSITFARAE